MLTDYLPEPPGSAAAGAALPGGAKAGSGLPITGSDVIRLPCIRPSVGKEALLELLHMQTELLARLEDITHYPLEDDDDALRLIASVTHALSDPVVRLVRNVHYAQVYARSKFDNNASWIGPHRLTIVNMPPMPVWMPDLSDYQGLIDTQYMPCPALVTERQDKAFRYLLSSAATVHSGMVWASDLLKTYAFQEIQAALLACAAPCRPDWRDCPRVESVRDYERAKHDEYTLVRTRVVSHDQLLTLYDRPAVAHRMNRLAILTWGLAGGAGLKPDGSGYGPLAPRVFIEPRAVSLCRFTVALYLLTFLLPLLRETVDVTRLHSFGSEGNPTPDPGRYTLASQKSQALDQKGIPHQSFFLQPGQPDMFPSEMEAMSFARQGGRHLPYFTVINNDTGLEELLVPSREGTTARLRRMYGMPEPEMLAALPDALERLTAIEEAEFGRRLEDRLGALYLGLRDVRPAFVEGVESRSPDECPPEDLFHCFLLEKSEDSL